MENPAAARRNEDSKDEKKDDQKSQEHRLETPWSFLFNKKPSKVPADKSQPDDFVSSLCTVATVDTVESFWRTYAYITPPDQLPVDMNMYLFRHKLAPAWESFPTGGCWIIKVRKRNGVINRLWEELLFACIGELFEEPDVAGVAVSTRAREDILSVWNKDNQSKVDVRFKIGEKLKGLLNLDESTLVEYKFFHSSLRDGSTFRNAKPYVFAARARVSSISENHVSPVSPPAAPLANAQSPRSVEHPALPNVPIEARVELPVVDHK
eukprot:TRINITY_DN319_c0_g1_i2.p1 TRINITY_DN319_c0_g1~~TRINITY_DN319_c0_g1_i2.p1  ORF type:complete len:266 (+),score=101.54 TRINITY_DN319_c0_g1_i2:86-883(+)